MFEQRYTYLPKFLSNLPNERKQQLLHVSSDKGNKLMARKFNEVQPCTSNVYKTISLRVERRSRKYNLNKTQSFLLISEA